MHRDIGLTQAAFGRYGFSVSPADSARHCMLGLPRVKHKSGGGNADGREMRVLITTQHIKTAAFSAEASAASASYDQTGEVTAHELSAGR